MATDGRKGRPRRDLQALIRETEPNCWLCGSWIDQTLDPQRDPMGSTIDEVIPYSQGGSTTDPANCRHAHRACNTYRGDRPVTPDLIATLHDYLTRKGYRPAAAGSTSRDW